MRVLLCCWAWPSHYLPLVPVGWALQAAGHEVRVASQPALAPVITDSGLVAVPTGADLDHAQVHRRVLDGLPLTAVPAAPPPGASMRGWRRDARDRVRRVFGVFTAYAEAMLDDLFDVAWSWRPDLIVYDPTTYAAPIVAAALHIPAVRHIHGVDVTYQARDVVPELIAPMCARLGLDEVAVLGGATVDPCPPSIQTPARVRRIPVRYVPYNGPAVLPDWLHEQPPHRRICVTWGTSTTRIAGPDLFLPRQVLDAVRDLDVELVVTLRPEDAARLRDVPAAVRVVDSVPLHLLLPTCDVLVHQGGNGTLLTAALFAVPQLVLPQLPDQAFQADCLVNGGSAVVLRPDEVEVPAVRAALDGLLTRPAYQDAARRLRAEMLAMPTPAQVVADLEQLTSA
jgi:UDP:flavonoid glycosyltransferase YjiC (YdhE family)